MAALARSMTGLVLVMVALLGLTALGGCENTGKAGTSTVPVQIGKKNFFLELAADDATRMRGLGGREHIDDDGGMIFVFPPSGVQIQDFVMRDCPIGIDIIYTDGAGRVLTVYNMKPEGARGPGEGQPGQMGNAKYEKRLTKYSSKYAATFAIELQAGMIQKTGVKEGDLLNFDVEGLKKAAR